MKHTIRSFLTHRQKGAVDIDLLKGWIIKPEGKPVLVPATDARPEWNNAKNDIMEENQYE